MKTTENISKVKELLLTSPIKELYANTYYSIIDRIDKYGYIEESFVPNRYPGCFARTSATITFLLEETGELDLAVRTLRFVLDTMKRNKLSRPPHVIGSISINADGSIDQFLDMVNQIDGTAHIISAYADLIINNNRYELFDEYWGLMSYSLDLHTDQPYFYSNEGCVFDVAKMHIFHNTCFEHSRSERYWSCYDMLSQSFMGAALERMLAVAKLKCDTQHIKLWERKLTLLKKGVDKYLTTTYKGKKIYMEMRLPDSNTGIPYTGMGWVSMSPIAAQWQALNKSILKNTVEAIYEKLWQAEPCKGTLNYMPLEIDEAGHYKHETIGKGIGWDIDFARQQDNYEHIIDWLEFLIAYHKPKLYSECMFVTDGEWKTRDCGNGEQAGWWCWSIARLLKALGLSPIPDRNDTTDLTDLLQNQV